MGSVVIQNEILPHINLGGVLGISCGICKSLDKVRIICGRTQELKGYLTVCEKCLDKYDKKDYYILPDTATLADDIVQIASEMGIEITGFKTLTETNFHLYETRHPVVRNDFINSISLNPNNKVMEINAIGTTYTDSLYHVQNFPDKSGTKRYQITVPNIWWYDDDNDLYWDMLLNYTSQDLKELYQEILGYVPAFVYRIYRATCAIVPFKSSDKSPEPKIEPKVEEVKIVYL